MKMFTVLLCLGMVGAGAAGCGPLQSPMPPRPKAEEQKSIDEAWDKALRPVDRFDHQALLDILITTKSYEIGVDKLTLRSEKKVAVGTVVMEIHYDRLIPGDDRFEVQVLDGAGRVLRQDRYGREEIEQTYKALFMDVEHLRTRQAGGTATPEEVQQLAAYEARLRVIAEVCPKADNEKKENGKPGRLGK